MANSGFSAPDGLPAYLQPALRVFLSVDIVNSTAFKQAHTSASSEKKHRQDVEDEYVDRAEPWFSPISGFYRGIERKLAEEWEKCLADVKTLDKSDGAPPTLWKASGDEVIYVKQITDPFQTLLTIRAWMGTVNRHRLEIKGAYPSLDLKAAAWLAGFPVNNAEVVLRRTPELENPLLDLIADDPLLVNFHRLRSLHDEMKNDNGDLFRDFIGPSMDTGFRVSSLATPRKLATTIDLAYMLAYAGEQLPKHIALPSLKPPIFQYDGRVPLKGVSGGAPYPFFWVDMKEDETLLEEEDRLMGRQRLQCAQVSPFCTKFFGDMRDRGPFITPYIIGEQPTSPFGHFPEGHQKRLKALAYWSQELNKRVDERDSQLNAVKTEEVKVASPGLQAVNQIEPLLKFLSTYITKHKPPTPR